ncbi:general substrate transporter [Microdochium trichocladiopsis]|uniref:General substrate transporter n=1 Tax=Microdochium trichocladiopsis TaxID=1682393 RepID=A0A9P8Y9S6_9PEZI|nr:general substrate transporter [Microdochium trichocladiopsis]KAH7033707.1 general substrate transporter [Microdochium trichocladiopsis]
MLWTLIVRGFENGASGAVISVPAFRRRFGVDMGSGVYFISTSWQSAINGAPNAAGIVGASIAGWLSDRFGYRPVILSAAVINIASIGIEFGSTSLGMFLAGKMVNLLAIGALLNLCTAYVADVSPLAIRASVIGFCNLSQCIGPFIAAIMINFTSKWDSDMAWQSVIAAQWGFAGVALIGQFFMPEAPSHLVRKGRMEAAQASLERLYSDQADAKAHLYRIQLTLEEAELSNSGSYLDCFRGTNLRRTLVGIMVFLSEPMSGLGFVGSYGALVYQMLDISDEKSFQIAIGAQVLSMSGATIAFLLSDWWGRRPMYIFGCCSLCVLMMCMGIAGSLTSTAAVTAAVAFYTMFNFFYNVGVGSTVYALAGELPTTVLRSKSLAISISTSNAFNTMWSFVAPLMFNEDAGNLKAKIGFVFGGIMFIFAVLAWFYVPETRRRTYEELDELFMNKVPARQFRTYKTIAEQRAAEAFAIREKVKATMQA